MADSIRATPRRCGSASSAWSRSWPSASGSWPSTAGRSGPCASARRSSSRSRRSRRRLAAVAENSSDSHRHRLDGRVAQYLNEAGRQLVGLEASELPRVTIGSFFFPDDLPYIEQHIMPATMEHGRWVGEFRFRHFKTGAAIPVLYNSFLIRDPETREPMALATVTADLTERKRAEEERVRLKDEMIRLQAAMLRELSTPLLRISDRAVIMPLIGAVDSSRAAAVLERLLQGVSAEQSRVVILDITGVSNVDSHVADALIRTAKAVRLLGAQMVLTGIRPEVAQILVGRSASIWAASSRWVSSRAASRLR